MGRRGPLPKPTARKLLEGNPGKRKLPKDEPMPDSIAAPPPPPWMAPLAKEAWRSVAAEMAAVGLLHRLDLTTLELYAVTYAHWRDMVAAVVTEGHTKTFTDKDGRETNAQPTPEATRASAYAEQLNKLCRVLGVGPAHRVGLGVTVTADGSGKATARDPIAEALAGGDLSRATPPPAKAPTKKAVTKKDTTKKTTAKKATAKKAPPKKAPAKKSTTKKPSSDSSDSEA